jgi:uncharacterized lipoprotein YmbA
MKKHALRCLLLPLFTLSLFFLAGCASSPPSRFYALTPSVGGQTSPSGQQREITQLFSIGPIDIADYLDRPQIVTRTSENRLDINEFERWGGSLKADVSRVLVENLSALLAKDGLMAVSWKGSYRGMLISVPVSIYRFEAAPGGDLRLEAKWGVLAKDAKTVEVAREALIIVPVAGTDYASIVGAMSEALGRLSRDMAPAVVSVVEKRPQTPGGEPSGKK